MSTRKGEGLEKLKELIADYGQIPTNPTIDTARIAPDYFEGLKKTFPQENLYKLWLVITQDVNFMPIEKKRIADASSFITKVKYRTKKITT